MLGIEKAEKLRIRNFILRILGFSPSVIAGLNHEEKMLEILSDCEKVCGEVIETVAVGAVFDKLSTITEETASEMCECLPGESPPPMVTVKISENEQKRLAGELSCFLENTANWCNAAGNGEMIKELFKTVNSIIKCKKKSES